MDNKVVIVTGANTGLGKESVLDLVERGAKVYMACRSSSRCEAAAKDVKQITGAEDSRVIVMQLDLSSYASVRSFVKEFKKRESRLDVLMNNAGVWMQERIINDDGNEMTIGTNHLGHFLLTNLLLDTIIASAPSRVVTLSAKLHGHDGPLDFEDLNMGKDFTGIRSYSHSKQANVMFSRELGKRLKGSGVTTYTLHPGVILTELLRANTWINNAVVKPIAKLIGSFFLKSTKEGIQTQICCAVDEELGKETGKYYSDVVETAILPFAEDDANCKKLWDISVALVNLKPEEMAKQVR